MVIALTIAVDPRPPGFAISPQPIAPKRPRGLVDTEQVATTPPFAHPQCQCTDPADIPIQICPCPSLDYENQKIRPPEVRTEITTNSSNRSSTIAACEIDIT